jgi:hypothetical protein
MDSQSQMTLEQQFELRLFAEQVSQLSKEESQELLVNLRETMIIQTNILKDIIKESWDIGKDMRQVVDY